MLFRRAIEQLNPAGRRESLFHSRKKLRKLSSFPEEGTVMPSCLQAGGDKPRPYSTLVGEGFTPTRSYSTLVGEGFTPARSYSIVVGEGFTPARSYSIVVGEGFTPTRSYLSRISLWLDYYENMKFWGAP
jgi:hypothetical protein